MYNKDYLFYINEFSLSGLNLISLADDKQFYYMTIYLGGAFLELLTGVYFYLSIFDTYFGQGLCYVFGYFLAGVEGTFFYDFLLALDYWLSLLGYGFF